MAKNKDPKIDQINGEFKAIDNKKGDGEYTVALVGDTWNKYKRKAKNKIVSTMDIKGFRKGKIPAFYIDRYVSQEVVLRKAAESALYSAYMFAMNQKTELKPFDMEKTTPKIEDISDDKVVYSFVFSLRPAVKLGKYKNLGIEHKVTKTTNKNIEDEVRKVFRRFANFEKSKETAANDDIIVIDFEGKIGGKPFAGNSAKQFEVEIGSGKMLEDFEKQLIGLKEGQNKKFKVTFPEDYHALALQNATAEFNVKVNEVRKIKYPQFNDKLVTETKIPNVKTMNELKTHLRDNLDKKNKEEADGDFIADIMEAIMDGSKFTISPKLLMEETKNSINRFKENLKLKNLKIEDYLKRENVQYEVLENEIMDDIEAKFQIEMTFIEIAKQENISIGEEDIKEFYELVKIQNPAARREQVDMQIKKDPTIKTKLQNEKIVKHLKKWNIKKVEKS